MTELQSCHEQLMNVGLRYENALSKSKFAAMKYSYVEIINPLYRTQMVVKEMESSNVRACYVNLST